MADLQSSTVHSFLFHFFFFFLIIFCTLLPFANPLSFSFPNFNATTSDLIDYQNDTYFYQGIQLTGNERGNNLNDNVGRAVYKQPLPLWDSETGEVTDFTTHFTFIINSFNSTNYGDGVAFFLSPYPSVVPANSSGGYLGLFSSDSALNVSSNKLVAVEFDTYPNRWDPRASDDGLYDHVGIDVNSIRSATNETCRSSIKEGQVLDATVAYNSSEILTVALTYADGSGPIYTTHETLTLHYKVDLRKVLPEKVAIGFSAATGSGYEMHTILSWDFSSTLEARSTIATEPAPSPALLVSTSALVVNKKKSKIGMLVMLVIATGMVMIAAGIVWFILWWRKMEKQSKKKDAAGISMIDVDFDRERGPKGFPFEELAAATHNFAAERVLGEGGFGAVYKGFLDGEEVAIKRVSVGSNQGKKEYVSEVRIISRLRHRNLVQLIGWCHEQGKFLLVYRFMANGSLDRHLYDRHKLLLWPMRYKIALGLASALFYLHEEWEQCVVHRDVKPSNVMLDSDFEAKLGDFGLARLVDHEVGLQATILAGTMGYLAPESAMTACARKESDVYSFGVVALEIACDRRPLEPGKATLVGWVWELYGRRMVLEAADERLELDFDEKEMEQLMVVGLWCAHPDHTLRPSIRQAISVLNFEAPLPDLPPKMPIIEFVTPFEVINSSSWADSSCTISVSTGITENSLNMASASSSTSSSSVFKSSKVDLQSSNNFYSV